MASWDWMAPKSIRQMSVADLNEEGLVRLIDHGETLFVERKEKEPADGIGVPVASFANTLGGWLLIGVGDKGEIKGFDPGRGDFTDKVRHKLRTQIEPLPPFAATVLPLDGKQIGVIRVFESLDTPHLVTATGSIPVREPGGTRNVRDRSELIDLARRGEEARAAAENRLQTLPYVQSQIETEYVAQGQRLRQVIVRAAPLTRSPGFADRVLSTAFGVAARETAQDLFPGPPAAQPGHRTTEIALAQRGFTATASQFGSHHRASVLADAGGVLMVRREYPKIPAPDPTHLRPETVEEDLGALLGAAARLFDKLDTHGRAVSDHLLRQYKGVEFVHQRAGAGAIPSDQIHVGGEITLPPDADEKEALSRQWANELARAAGLEVWQELKP